MEESVLVAIGDLKIKLHVHRERRRYSRVSLTKKGINLRIPQYRSDLGEDPIDWALRWIEKQYRKNPSVFDRYRSHTYESGKMYTTPYGRYSLEVTNRPSGTVGTRIIEDVIHLVGPIDATAWQEVSKLLAKVVVRQLRIPFTMDVNRINQEFFAFEFNKVRLKYNVSNWGSCSSKGNLNFNSRLLLAPRPIMEYVIIHELAHLQEMNHSQRFWALVAHADPNFKRHQQWLKEHGPALIY